MVSNMTNLRTCKILSLTKQHNNAPLPGPLALVPLTLQMSEDRHDPHSERANHSEISTLQLFEHAHVILIAAKIKMFLLNT